MSSTTESQIDHLKERTEASLKKFQERADELRGELGDARAATKVQIKAMVERLDEKYEDAKSRYSSLRRSSPTVEEMQSFHDEIVSDLQSMLKTINRRIH